MLAKGAGRISHAEGTEQTHVLAERISDSVVKDTAARQAPLAGRSADRRILTLSPYGAKNPTSGGTKRIHYLNRGYARAGWEVLQISSTSIGAGIRQTIRSGMIPLLGPRKSLVAPGYREEPYFNPFVILGNRLLRRQDGAQVAASMLPRLLRPSPRMIREIAAHKVILFEHPQMFDMAAPFLRDDHIVILNAHNIETRLYPRTPGQSELAAAAAEALYDVERRVMRRADIVLVCSEDDRAIAITDYGVDPARVRVAPNGVDCESVGPASATERDAAKRALGLSGPAAIFVGSRWGPNLEAAREIVRLAPLSPQVTWLIVGTVGAELRGPLPGNVVVTGPVDRIEDWYGAADVALNPMTSGSGSNIKMFEYLAAGLPIVTTAFGARGVEDESGLAVIAAEIDETPAAVAALLTCPQLPARRLAARLLAEAKYDWSAIAADVIDTLEATLKMRD